MTKRDHSEDVRLMLSAGESLHRIAERLGVKPGSLGRNLHRHGHTDLARQFWALARREEGRR